MGLFSLGIRQQSRDFITVLKYLIKWRHTHVRVARGRMRSNGNKRYWKQDAKRKIPISFLGVGFVRIFLLSGFGVVLSFLFVCVVFLLNN